MEILPNLWLGDVHTSKDMIFIQNNNINCIFNCTVNITFPEGVRYKYRIPVKDNGNPEEVYLMYKILDKSVKLIKKHLLQNDVILVHCHAGRQRSVALVIAFILKYVAGISTVSEALEIIQEKRPVSGKPKLNFMRALKKYEGNLYKNA